MRYSFPTTSLAITCAVLLFASAIVTIMPAAFAAGTGAFEGAQITKIADLDAVNKGVGAGNATAPFIDSIDWYGGGNSTDESFFIFRYCTEPENCVIGTATPDGGLIQSAFNPPAGYANLSGAKVSPAGNALLFKAMHQSGREDLFTYFKGSTVMYQLTNGTAIGTYSWLADGNVTYSEPRAELTCLDGAACKNQQFSYSTKIWAIRPTGEKLRTIYESPNTSIADYAVSPDGKKVAYVDFMGEPFDPKKLWRLSVFYSGSIKVLESNRDGDGYYSPSWTPDGSAILYGSVSQKPFAARGNSTLGASGWLGLVGADGEERGRMILGGNTEGRGAVPFGAAITHDGSRIIFAVNQDVEGDGIDGAGIYSMALAHPIPEFPFAAAIAAVPVAAAIAWFRLRWNR